MPEGEPARGLALYLSIVDMTMQEGLWGVQVGPQNVCQAHRLSWGRYEPIRHGHLCVDEVSQGLTHAERCDPQELHL